MTVIGVVIGGVLVLLIGLGLIFRAMGVALAEIDAMQIDEERL